MDKEYIDKNELKKLEQYQFGVSMCNIDEYVKISDIDRLPTVTELEVTEVVCQYWKKKGALEFAEKIKEIISDTRKYASGSYVSLIAYDKIVNLLEEIGCSDE